MGYLDKLMSSYGGGSYRPREEEEEERSFFERYFSNPSRSLAKSATLLPARLTEGLEFLAQAPGVVLPKSIEDPFEDWVARTQDKAAAPFEEAAADINVHPGDSFAEKALITTAGAIPDLAAILGTGAIGGAIKGGSLLSRIGAATKLAGRGAQVAGGATAATLVGGQSFKEARERGVDETTAFGKAGVEAGLSAALEVTGAKYIARMLKSMPRSQMIPWAKRLKDAMAVEGLTEGAQEVVALAGEAATGKTFSEGEIGERLALSVTAGGLMAGGIGVASAPFTNMAPDKKAQLEATRRRMLTVERGLGIEGLQLKEEEMARFDERAQKSKYLFEEWASRRDQYLEENPSVDEEMFTDEVNNFMTMPELGIQPPAELAPILTKMRESVDEFSNMMIQSGMLTPEQEDTFRAGMESYLRRSYTVFEDPKGQLKLVAPHLSNPNAAVTDKWQAARDFVEADMVAGEHRFPRVGGQEVDPATGQPTNDDVRWQDLDRATKDRNLDETLKLVMRVDPDAFVSTWQNIAPTEQSPFFRRKDVPEQMRAIMGEIKDPGEAYIRSMERVSRALYSAQLMRSMAESGFRNNVMFKEMPITSEEDVDPFIPLGKVTVGQKVIHQGEANTGDPFKQQLLTDLMRGAYNSAPFSKPPDAIATLAENAGDPAFTNEVDLYDTLDDQGLTAVHDQLTPEGEFGGVTQDLGNPTAELAVQRLDPHQGRQLWVKRSYIDALTRGVDESGPAWLKVVTEVNGVVKLLHTVGSVQTQARNLVSNVTALLANGNWMYAWNSAKGIPSAWSASFSKLPSEQRQELVLELRRAGILGGNVDVGDIDSWLGQRMETMEKAAGRPGSALTKGVLRLLTKPPKAMKKLYQVSDDMAKAVNYFAEKEKIKRAYPMATDEEVRAQAAENTKQGLQNYSRVPEFFKEISRRMPLVGPFVNFPVASIINLKNIAKIGFQEMGLAAPDKGSLIEKYGTTRLSKVYGISRVTSLGAVLASAKLIREVALRASESLDDWDEQDQIDLVKAQPFYSRDSELVPLWKDGTRVGYVDLSFIDYFNAAKRPFLAMMRSHHFDENPWIAAAKSAAEPFLAKEIFAGSVGEVFANQDRYGNEIYQEGSGSYEQLKESLTHLLYSNMGGTPKHLRRIAYAAAGEVDPRSRREYDLGTESLALLGPRLMITDFQRNLSRVSGWAAAQRRMSKQILKRMLMDKGQVSEAAARHTTAVQARVMERTYQTLADSYFAALRQGVVPQAALHELSESTLPKSEWSQLVSERTRPDQLAEGFIFKELLAVNPQRRKRLSYELRSWKKQRPQSTAQEFQVAREKIARFWRPIDLQSAMAQYDPRR